MGTEKRPYVERKSELNARLKSDHFIINKLQIGNY